ncbi:MAG: nitroreductase family protein [bacterium]|nr:nitroreductase family protein [bacterium]
MTWEKDLKPVLRPEDVHMGKMKIDMEKCNGCGLCVENCLFRTWQMGKDKKPYWREDGACFSCYNCMVACPVDAVSIETPYYVGSGFWKTQPHPLAAVRPLQPFTADGKPDEWTEMEKIILTRRSVRNFKDTPVPEALIRRVIEAGRFAPTSGNCQPFQFVVVTKKSLIDELNTASYNLINGIFNRYMSEEGLKELAKMYEANPSAPGGWDPRIILGGIGQSVVTRVNPVLLGAPAVILIAADYRSIGGAQIQVGISGENMILAAISLGLKATWVGFVAHANAFPPLMQKLGIQPPFSIASSIVLGYPRFRQEGIVAREYRPITWHREGQEKPDVEAVPPLPECKPGRVRISTR